MAPALSVSCVTTRTTASVDEVGHDCRHLSAKLSSARSKPAHKEAIASKYKIVVFPRESLLSNTSLSMQDLEINSTFVLDRSVPTSRTFAQDDCLHMELIGRARYNFHQGLVNMKEVLEAQRCRRNASIAAFVGSNGRELATAPCRFSAKD